MGRIKEGDKVAKFFKMNDVGIVKELIIEKNSQWMVGGTMSSRNFVLVEFKDGRIEKINRDDLFLVEKK